MHLLGFQSFFCHSVITLNTVYLSRNNINNRQTKRKTRNDREKCNFFCLLWIFELFSGFGLCVTATTWKNFTFSMQFGFSLDFLKTCSAFTVAMCDCRWLLLLLMISLTMGFTLKFHLLFCFLFVIISVNTHNLCI